MLKKIYKSIRNAFWGIKQAYLSDRSFRMEIGGSIFYIIFGFLMWPLSGIEIILLILSYFLILITELINTSMEQMLERIHPQKHYLIGNSKDIASSAVLLAFIFSIIVVIFITLNHLGVINFI